MSAPDETANHIVLSREQVGKLLVERGKRVEAVGLILELPDTSLNETLTTLIEIYEYYKEVPK